MAGFDRIKIRLSPTQNCQNAGDRTDAFNFNNSIVFKIRRKKKILLGQAVGILYSAICERYHFFLLLPKYFPCITAPIGLSYTLLSTHEIMSK